MKILHINSYYSTTLFYKNLFKEQIKNGLDIDVFVPISSNFLKNDFDFGEYTTISKSYNQYDRFFFHLKHHKIYKDIRKRYNIKDYSLAHAYSLFSNGYIAMKLKKKFGIPYIVAVRNTDVNFFFKKMIHLRKLGIEVLKEANQVIFLSQPYQHTVIETYVPDKFKESVYQKSVVIPNGIDEFWFNYIGDPKKQPKKSNLKLLQVGDINKNKNIETTVKAVELLKEKGYKVKLDVVGKVKDKNVFNKIKELDFVNYLGFRPKEELINILRENDIFVLPSINETFGLVYAEAMSQGLPVIYSKGQGFDGQFGEGEIGYSVHCNKHEEISEKVEKIINEYEKLSKKCISGVRKFKWKDISTKYCDIYRKFEEGRFQDEI